MLSRVWVCECYWGDCISPHCHRQPTQSCHYPVTLIVLVFQVNEKAPRPNFSAFLPSIASPLCSATHIHSRMHFISARPSSDRFNLIWIFNGESYGARRCCICVCADSKIMTTRHGDSECAALFLKDVCIFNATRTAKKGNNAWICVRNRVPTKRMAEKKRRRWKSEMSSTDRRLIYRKAIISDHSWILIMMMIFLYLILSL